jgi:predicted DsbA family dithiol-disulfide isomerase
VHDAAATWAKQQSMLLAFAEAAFRHRLAHGRDLSGVDALAAVAEDLGLSGEELWAAIESPAVKDQLRAATAHAWELGLRGVPTVRLGQVKRDLGRLGRGEHADPADGAVSGAGTTQTQAHRRSPPSTN